VYSGLFLFFGLHYETTMYLLLLLDHPYIEDTNESDQWYYQLSVDFDFVGLAL
jgi:hypothetical protein